MITTDPLLEKYLLHRVGERRLTEKEIKQLRERAKKIRINEYPCKYCGFVASRYSDEDCPDKPMWKRFLDWLLRK